MTCSQGPPTRKLLSTFASEPCARSAVMVVRCRQEMGVPTPTLLRYTCGELCSSFTWVRVAPAVALISFCTSRLQEPAQARFFVAQRLEHCTPTAVSTEAPVPP